MFLRLLSRITKLDPHKVALSKDILKDMAKYVVPFLHKDRAVTMKLTKSYVYLIFSKLCFFGGPFLLKSGIDALKVGAMIDPWPMFLGYGLCYSGSVIFESLRNMQVVQLANLAVKDISHKSLRHILKLDPEFFLRTSQAKTLNKLNRAMKSIQSNIRTVNQFLLPITVDIVMSAFLIYQYFGTGYVVTFLGSCFMYCMFTVNYSDYRRKGVQKQKTYQRNIDFILSQTFTNYHNVKFYSAQEFQAQRYLNALDCNYHQLNENQYSLGVLNSLQRILFTSGMTINMILAGNAAKKGLMSAGDIVMMQTLMMQLLTPLFFLGVMYRGFTDNLLDILKLYEVLALVPMIREPEKPIECGELKGDILFRNVSFCYPGQNTEFIKDLSFQIREKEFVAIMGPSGVGKSTLFNLIFRLYDALKGQVLLDGKNVKDMRLADFRSQIGLVSQNAYLFNDSVINNIRYGNPNASLEDIYQLAEQLGIHQLFLSLQKGYDTFVGEKGSIFSGGQRQRLSVLRALLGKKKILLLDEPSSALDRESEQKVAEVLRRYSHCTRVMITHKDSLSQYADRVIQLSKL